MILAFICILTMIKRKKHYLVWSIKGNIVFRHFYYMFDTDCQSKSSTQTKIPTYFAYSIHGVLHDFGNASR